MELNKVVKFSKTNVPFHHTVIECKTVHVCCCVLLVRVCRFKNFLG